MERMKIDILTLFQKGLVEIKIHNLRDWATDKHKTVDDRPYGGGAGMVIRVDVVDRALRSLRNKAQTAKWRVILLTPRGKVFDQQRAQKLSKFEHLILIAGHYEGFDARVHKYLVDEEISIGNYVLTGGELPAMILVDSIVRLLPGVLGAEESVVDETHTKPGYIKYPVYTRPENFKGWKVPEVLLSGNHREIEKWRKKKARSSK